MEASPLATKAYGVVFTYHVHCHSLEEIRQLLVSKAKKLKILIDGEQNITFDARCSVYCHLYDVLVYFKGNLKRFLQCALCNHRLRSGPTLDQQFFRRHGDQ